MPNPFHNTQETQAKLLAEGALNLTAKNSTKPATNRNTVAHIAPLFSGPLKLDSILGPTPHRPDAEAAYTQSLLFRGLDMSTTDSSEVHGMKEDDSAEKIRGESVNVSQKGQVKSGTLLFSLFLKKLLIKCNRRRS